MITARFYTPSDRAQWDAAVVRARASSFLFQRAFMDYHRDRFRDRSLLAYDEKGTVCGLLPAAEVPGCPGTVASHAGLTYGGLLTAESGTTVRTGEMLEAACRAYREAGFERLVYKAVPYIYHACPCEEDLYWLYRRGARLTARAVSSVIDLAQPLPLSKLRQRKVKQAARERLTFRDDGQCLPAFFALLSDVLQARHGVRPVHSLEELERLMKAFPSEITLHTVWLGDCLLAGCLLFHTSTVLHVQYIASGEEGRRVGALDALFARLINQAAAKGGARYFDFGISTERGGLVLNEGLIFQKEGFGARAVCYDTYEITLTDDDASGTRH